MNRLHVHHRTRLPAAFTLIEALVSISITAIAGSVLLLGTTSSLQATSMAQEQTIAAGMAQQLMDEVVGGRYHAVGVGAYQTNLGPSSYEQGGAGRERFDDVDDFNGFRSRPPEDPFGIELGTGNGDGTVRHSAFRTSSGFFDNWQQEIYVYYVDESDLTTRLPAGTTSDYRAVEVRIVYDHPDRGARELARLRRVVAYVAPL